MPTLAEIVARFGGELVGAGEIAIRRVAPLGSAGPDDLAFLANPKYRAQLAATRAGAVIVEPGEAAPGAAIVTSNPYLYFARVAAWLTPPKNWPVGIHATAVVEGSVAADASIGPNVYVAPGAQVGPGAMLAANCTILHDAVIGAGTRLYPNVTVSAGCRVGARGILHAGVVIGADGFGFAREADGHWEKIPQVGGVRIGDDVEIGANTTIDRGAMVDTVIEDGVKLDNQIQIGHNVRIGAHTAVAGCTGIAGSTTIGQRCMIGGAASIIGHLTIADDVTISAGTFVAKSIARAGTYSGGAPMQEHAHWLRNFAHLRHLDAMADRIRSLEQRLAELEKRA